MKDLFEIACGSHIGRSHRLNGRNNQDAYYCYTDTDITIAVVCDGCGSSPHSEVGAYMGANILVKSILDTLKIYSDSTFDTDKFWELVRFDALREICNLINAPKQDQRRLLEDYYLFTSLIAVITKDKAVVVSIGDGFVSYNNIIQQIGPFPNNQPPYLTYGLFSMHDDAYRFKIIINQPTEEVDNILIATDGLSDLLAHAQDSMPGKDEVVGDISQFWLQDKYFRNSDMIRRKLSLINRDISKPIWSEKRMDIQNGLLFDDTTLIVLRRIKDAGRL